MPRTNHPSILITSGPTREYLDPVRYISNASSGKMGCALAEEALAAGFDVTIVSGPVTVSYPEKARVIPVVTTEEMLARSLEIFPQTSGAIGVAAPCDFRPAAYSPSKMTKDRFTRADGSGGHFFLELEETPDIFAALGTVKQPRQWLVPFALETNDHHARALKKLVRKHGDLIVVNNQTAIGASSSSLDILTPEGTVLESLAGTKQELARRIIQILVERFGNCFR